VLGREPSTLSRARVFGARRSALVGPLGSNGPARERPSGR